MNDKLMDRAFVWFVGCAGVVLLALAVCIVRMTFWPNVPTNSNVNLTVDHKP